jgi:hypothetical protein
MLLSDVALAAAVFTALEMAAWSGAPDTAATGPSV